jgi:hypothetical protein
LDRNHPRCLIDLGPVLHSVVQTGRERPDRRVMLQAEHRLGKYLGQRNGIRVLGVTEVPLKPLIERQNTNVRATRNEWVGEHGVDPTRPSKVVIVDRAVSLANAFIDLPIARRPQASFALSASSHTTEQRQGLNRNCRVLRSRRGAAS